MMKKLLILMLLLISNSAIQAIELELAVERVEPGIILIFEGAIKDRIIPKHLHLAKNKTDIHIEARANWDTKKAPIGAPKGGFVSYLHITAQVINQKTKLSTFIDLVPHINLIDNLHYARNISLPGKITDLYTVIFKVLPPSYFDLAFHRDWVKKHGKRLFKRKIFKYKNVNFAEIAKASRD